MLKQLFFINHLTSLLQPVTGLIQTIVAENYTLAALVWAAVFQQPSLQDFLHSSYQHYPAKAVLTWTSSSHRESRSPSSLFQCLIVSAGDSVTSNGGHNNRQPLSCLSSSPLNRLTSRRSHLDHQNYPPYFRTPRMFRFPSGYQHMPAIPRSLI